MTTTFVLRDRSKRDPDWTAVEDAKVIRLRNSGLSANEIADQFDNRSRAALKNRVWKLCKQGAI